MKNIDKDKIMKLMKSEIKSKYKISKKSKERS